MPVAKLSPRMRLFVAEMCHHRIRYLLGAGEGGDIVWCSQCGAICQRQEVNGRRNKVRTWVKPHLKAHKNLTQVGVRLS